MTNISPSLGKVHQGDCVKSMNQLPEGCIDLAFADPPFNIGYEYDVYRDNKNRQEYLLWSREWIGAVHRVLKPTGAFWLAIGDEFAAELKILSQDIGFSCRSWVIWYYTFGVNCKAKFSRSHAHLFYFTKHPTEFTFRADALENRIPSARQLVYADARANPRGRLPDDTWVLRPQDLADCFTSAEDTWYFPRVAGTFKERAGFHGCQMPEQLLGRIIRYCSLEDQIVLDPFSGSATTVAVAKKLGRRQIAFELSSEYVDRGNARLNSICIGDPLDGAQEPTVSAPATPRNQERKGKLVPVDTAGKPESQSDPVASSWFETRLMEAFRQSSDGYSADRLVADPELNRQFVDRCREAGLPGDPRNWNHSLFALRKTGRLTDVPTTKRTQVSWEECDDFLFASEIALRNMFERGYESLDEVLCDPGVAELFDREAQALAPGFSSFHYRWGALKLRKEAKTARSRAEFLKTGRLGQTQQLDEICWETVPESAAVYLVSGSAHSSPIYAGGSLNLRNRLRKQFATMPLEWWTKQAGEGPLRFSFFTTENRTTDLFAYQLLLVHAHQPRFNVRELATAATR